MGAIEINIESLVSNAKPGLYIANNYLIEAMSIISSINTPSRFSYNIKGIANKIPGISGRLDGILGWIDNEVNKFIEAETKNKELVQLINDDEEYRGNVNDFFEGKQTEGRDLANKIIDLYKYLGQPFRDDINYVLYDQIEFDDYKLSGGDIPASYRIYVPDDFNPDVPITDVYIYYGTGKGFADLQFIDVLNAPEEKTGKKSHEIVSKMSTANGIVLVPYYSGFWKSHKSDPEEQYMEREVELMLNDFTKRFNINHDMVTLWETGASAGGLGTLNMGILYKEYIDKIRAVDPMDRGLDLEKLVGKDIKTYLNYSSDKEVHRDFIYDKISKLYGEENVYTIKDPKQVGDADFETDPGLTKVFDEEKNLFVAKSSGHANMANPYNIDENNNENPDMFEKDLSEMLISEPTLDWKKIKKESELEEGDIVIIYNEKREYTIHIYAGDNKWYDVNGETEQEMEPNWSENVEWHAYRGTEK